MTSGITRRSSSASMGRRPGWIQVEQKPPELAAAAEVAEHARPRVPDPLRGHEHPHVARVGLTEQRTHPVGALCRIARSEPLPKVGNCQIRPPQEVRPCVGIRELRIGGGQHDVDPSMPISVIGASRFDGPSSTSTSRPIRLPAASRDKRRRRPVVLTSPIASSLHRYLGSLRPRASPARPLPDTKPAHPPGDRRTRANGPERSRRQRQRQTLDAVRGRGGRRGSREEDVRRCGLETGPCQLSWGCRPASELATRRPGPPASGAVFRPRAGQDDALS